MLNWFIKYNLPFLCVALFCSCGNQPTSNLTNTSLSNESQIITIIDYTFIPNTISALPGETIFFYNQNFLSHQILSQSASNQFDDTGIFDSEIIPQGQTGFIVIPDDQATGTSLYFYDDFLQDEMTTPSGEIKIK